MLDDEQARARHGADPEEQRAERLGLTLRDPRGRLVEQEHAWSVREHAGQVDDAPTAGGELADVLVAERAEAQQLDELLDAFGHLGLRVHHRREVERRGQRVAHVDAALERDGDRLGHGEGGEEPPVLERPPEPEAGAGVGSEAR